jgi:hypothetical protein
MRFKLIFLLTFFILFVSISAHKKVLLKDVTSLTLQRGQYTQGRRSQPVPQLRCVGGSAQGQYAPAVVQCYNRGFDGHDVQWECRASMPKEYEFGRISVTCEGYDYPEDAYILAGSCGLEYELNSAPVGSAQYAKRTPSAPFENEESHVNWSGIIYFGIVCFIIYLLYLTLSGPRAGNEGDRNRGESGYGPGHPPGGGGGGPPPPGFRPYPPSYDEATKQTFTSAGSSGGTTGQPAAGGGGPGFFSGLGLGALGGYLYGNSGRNNEGTYRRRGWGGNQRNYGWGGGQTQFDRDTGFGGRSSTYQSYETSPPSSSTSSRHESTSFGGTTRR